MVIAPPRSTEIASHRPRFRCAAIRIARLALTRATFVPLEGLNVLPETTALAERRLADPKVLHSGPANFTSQKNSRRLELPISKNTLRGRLGQGPGSVDPRFAAGLPFSVPEILEYVAFRDSGKYFQQFSRDFPGVFLGNPRTHPTNSHSLLEFSHLGKLPANFAANFSSEVFPCLFRPFPPGLQAPQKLAQNRRHPSPIFN